MTVDLNRPPLLRNQNDFSAMNVWLDRLFNRVTEINSSMADDSYILRNGTRTMLGNWNAGSINIQAETFTSNSLSTSSLVWANASKVLASVTVGNSLSFSAGALDAIQDIRTTASPTFAGLTINGGAVFNEGSVDADFRVESNGNANMLNLDAGNNIIMLGGNTPDSVYTSLGGILQLQGTATQATIGQLIIAHPSIDAQPYMVFKWNEISPYNNDYCGFTGVATGVQQGGFYMFAGNFVTAARQNTMEIFQDVNNLGTVTLKTKTSNVRNTRIQMQNDGDLLLLFDNQSIQFGAGQDASIYYNGTNLIISPRDVGTGAVVIGEGAAGVDYQLIFNGETNDLTLTWMEDENYLTSTSVIRTTTSLYKRYYHLPMTSADPGLSGATWTAATANNVSGWQLNAATETLEFEADIHSDWDAASDLTVEVKFQLLASGSAGDTVDLKLVCRYMGVGDTSTKTQTVEVSTVTDGTQYKMYKAIFTINYDELSNVVDIGDVIDFTLNLETDTSEIDDVLITDGAFYYNTTHTYIESGDV
jgi:hypothetical protein